MNAIRTTLKNELKVDTDGLDKDQLLKLIDEQMRSQNSAKAEVRLCKALEPGATSILSVRAGILRPSAIQI